MRSGGLKDTEFGRTPRLTLKITIHALPQDHPSRPWPGHRLVDGSRRYGVDAVHEGGDGRWLTVLASEEVPA
jgi:hypothetical protein